VRRPEIGELGEEVVVWPFSEIRETRNNWGSPGLMAAEIIIEIISVDPYRGFLASMHD
jgi:hypothetical protein